MDVTLALQLCLFFGQGLFFLATLLLFLLRGRADGSPNMNSFNVTVRPEDLGGSARHYQQEDPDDDPEGDEDAEDERML